MSLIWHNGEWVSQDSKLFTFNDRIRLGDGFFDTMLAESGRLLHSGLHYQRLFDSASIMDIDFPFSFSEFEDMAQNLLFQNSYLSGRYVINTLVSRGVSDRGLSRPEKEHPQVIMKAVKAPEEYPPLKAITAHSVRRNEFSPLSRIKSLQYGDNIIALNEARQRGANEALLLNTQGRAACFTAGNLFIKLGPDLITPPISEGAVEGTTRRIFMEEYDVNEAPVTTDMIKDAETIFMTNAVRGAVFITNMDKRIFGHHQLQIDRNFHLKSNFKINVNRRT